jgi:hypothetical protein
MTVTLLNRFGYFTRPLDKVVSFCGPCKQNGNIQLLFIHIDKHLEIWVELHSNLPSMTHVATKVHVVYISAQLTIHTGINFFPLFKFLPMKVKTMEAHVIY